VPMPMKVQDPFSGRVVTRTLPVQVDVDEGLLQRIAARTGGEFFRASDGDALRAIFTRIDGLEKSEIKHSAFKRYDERYPQVLRAALTLLALAGVAWAAGLRVAPQ
jgi:hypothetical protein